MPKRIGGAEYRSGGEGREAKEGRQTARPTRGASGLQCLLDVD